MRATLDDINDIAEVRRLSNAARTRLLRAVVGDMSHSGPRTNRDRPFWIGSRVLLALAHLSPTRGAPSLTGLTEAIVSPDLARPGGLKASLAGRTARAGTAELTADGEGLRLVLASGPFSVTWTQVRDTLALIHFHLAADFAARWPDVSASLVPLVTLPEGTEAALSATLAGLSAIRRTYEKQHFDLETEERRASRLADHLRASRNGTRLGDPVTDAEILDFWLSELDAGARTLFTKVVEHAVVLERIRAELRARAALDATTELDDPRTGSERVDMPHAGLSGAHTADTVSSWPEALLDAIPTSPSFLTGTQRTALDRLFRLHPLQFGRQRTILRGLSFGAVQGGHVTRRQLHSTAEVAGPVPYQVIRTGHVALRAALTDLLVEALDLRRRTAPPPDPAEGTTATRSLPRVRPARRAGMADDREERAAQFALVDEALARIASQIDTYLPAGRAKAAADDEGFTTDSPIFLAAFDRLYRS